MLISMDKTFYYIEGIFIRGLKGLLQEVCTGVWSYQQAFN